MEALAFGANVLTVETITLANVLQVTRDETALKARFFIVASSYKQRVWVINLICVAFRNK